MQSLRGFGNALTAALLSILLTLGALSISLVGFIPEEAPAPTLTQISPPIPVTATHTLPPTPTFIAEAASPAPSATNSAAAAAACPAPQGWIQITVQAGDTLESLAARYGTNRDILKSFNCLTSDTLLPGTVLLAPSNLTSTPRVCNKGAAGWSPNYILQPGDTLYSIALRYYVTPDLLKSVNCLSSDQVRAGDALWVPIVATRTPLATPIPGIIVTYTSAPTEPLTSTALPFTLTPIPTQTFIPTSASTVTPIPTPTASPTEFPTNTP